MLFHLHFYCNFSLKWTHMWYTTCWKAQKVHRISSKKRKEKNNSSTRKIWKSHQRQFKALTKQIYPYHQVWQEITSRKDLVKSKQWSLKKAIIIVCYMLTAQLYFIMGGRFLKLEMRVLCKRRILSETRRFILHLCFRINGVQCYTTVH